MPHPSAGSRLSLLTPAVLATAGIVLAAAAQPAVPPPDLDRAAERWVRRTLDGMSVDEKVGQLLVASFESVYMGSDTEPFDRLARLVKEYHVGGFHVFGGSEPAPAVLLNTAYSTTTLGQPLAAASTANRLQALSRVPLLCTADFENGVGFRLAGATSFPRAMAFGAAGDERLAYEAGRITAIESRALGVHVNFAPVVDVNNNPRNPVINTRAFGEDPARVGELASAYARGLRAGGVLSVLKHFPGHGDTDVDSHLGLPVIKHGRDRLERLELAPFRAGIAAGADGIMVAHIGFPAIDAQTDVPASLSRGVVAGLLRRELGFGGLVFTDSMSMRAVSDQMSAGEAAVKAVQAGNDVVLHSPDPVAAFDAIKAAIGRGEIDLRQVDASVERLLRAKARLGLHQGRLVSLDEVPRRVGSRAHDAVADEVSRRSITLIRDEQGRVPLRLPRDARLLYLSVVDYPAGWGIAAPSRTFIPELRKRWPEVTAIELSDRTTPSEIDLVRAMTPRFDAVVASVFVRAASFSGRMDLAAPVTGLLRDLTRTAGAGSVPFVTVLFGNPYVATFLSDLPAVLLTYDLYDRAEVSAVRAIAGETAIGGRLPIALPDLFPVGHGLARAATPQTAARPREGTDRPGPW
jgi:beta-glucosidase-like glycosyl hydrolase